MIERIPDMPPGTLGFRAGGQVTAADITDVLLPPVHDAVARGVRLRVLVVLAPDLARIDPGALWEDLKAAADAAVRHRDAWERTAVATDHDWVRAAAGLLGWIAPGELRVFDAGEEDAARAWIAG